MFYLYDSDIRYIPKSITLSITVRSTDNLNLVPKYIMTSLSESPCQVFAYSVFFCIFLLSAEFLNKISFFF